MSENCALLYIRSRPNSRPGVNNVQNVLTDFGERHDDLVHLQVARVDGLRNDQELPSLILLEEAIFPDIVLLLQEASVGSELLPREVARVVREVPSRVVPSEVCRTPIYRNRPFKVRPIFGIGVGRNRRSF